PMYRSWLAEGFAKPGSRRKSDDFEIASNVSVIVTDDPAPVVEAQKPTLAFYIGGMGAKDMNFHSDVFARMGYESEVARIQDLFLEGHRDAAVAAVPDQLVNDISLIGPVGKIRDQVAQWAEAGITTMVVMSRSTAELERIADTVLG
ncbi:MAG: LLM class flavin-dependent oxidoreductase, partial [Actinomycetota bacterium]|nr:LLM class flavin-dependent oxidoreductase [Actinomycetota bacterium]